MASSFPEAMNYPGVLVAEKSRKIRHGKIYQENCHRIYSLAFWITDNELAADQLTARTFLRAFTGAKFPGAEQIDEAFLAEVRDAIPLGSLTLSRESAPVTNRVYGNIKRAHLERAVVLLPATEKLIFLFHDVEGYDHDRIGSLLGLTEQESRFGLHQARLRLRELVSEVL